MITLGSTAAAKQVPFNFEPLEVAAKVTTHFKPNVPQVVALSSKGFVSHE
jgi:hypothetical protein